MFLTEFEGRQCVGVLTGRPRGLNGLVFAGLKAPVAFLLTGVLPNVLQRVHEALTPRHFRYASGTVIMFE